MLEQEQILALNQKLDMSLVEHRKGSWNKETKSYNMLAYITGKTAIDTANLIFGYGNWGYKIISQGRDEISDEKKESGIATIYTCNIELSVKGCEFTFPGDGLGEVTSNNFQGHNKARKEASTDALKRALRHFGQRFGLSLYDEEDEVITPEGEPVKVKNILAAKNKPARRVVESAKPTKQIEASAQPAVVDIPAQPQESTRDALNRLYNKAVRARKCNSLPAFLFYVSGLAGEKVTAESITEQHIGLIEADLSNVA